ncbi:DNA-processing protein DprA [Cellulomonas endophytica]|uniref:DNA-processing protein DprA n=1 Tax=Cellulomonas endophytica TaxID=2494735 RepID=UPI001F0CA7FE|nr:DNA-processing protein DprA [Cellulomonas endophytica]
MSAGAVPSSPGSGSWDALTDGVADGVTVGVAVGVARTTAGAWADRAAAGGGAPATAVVGGVAGSDAERLALAAWSGLAEPADPVAALLVGALGPATALEEVCAAAGRVAAGAAADRVLGPLGELRGLDAPLPGDAPEDVTRRRRVVVRALERWAVRAPGVVAGAATALEAHTAAGGQLLVPGDPVWPLPVEDLEAATPFCLWVRGRLPAGRTVALVGARAATAYGEHVARTLASGAAESGLAVVSGGAFGIDAAAHRGALAAGGPTVVVLAGGVDRSYPAAHGRLFAEVLAAGGALLSEAPPGTLPLRSRFLLRNRLIAALTQGTVVVEAAWRSGALSTARHAAGLLRPLGVVPGPVTSVASAGCHRLVREGIATLVTCADDLRELVGPIGPATVAVPGAAGVGDHPEPGPGLGPHGAGAAAPDPGSAPPPGDRSPGLADEAQRVRAAGRGPEADAPGAPEDPVRARVRDALPTRVGRSPAAVAAAAGVTAGEAQGVLALLELDGTAERTSSGWRLRRP